MVAAWLLKCWANGMGEEISQFSPSGLIFYLFLSSIALFVGRQWYQLCLDDPQMYPELLSLKVSKHNWHADIFYTPLTHCNALTFHTL